MVKFKLLNVWNEEYVCICIYIYKVSLGRVQKKWMTLRGREQDSYNTGWDIFPLESFVALTYQTF